MSDTPNNQTLADALRDLKFSQRLEQAQLVAGYRLNSEQRMLQAQTMIRQLCMHRAFDLFSPDQERQLLDILEPIANPQPHDPTGQKFLSFLESTPTDGESELTT